MSQSENLSSIVIQLRKQFWSQISFKSEKSSRNAIAITKMNTVELKKLLLERRVNSVVIKLDFSDELQSWLKDSHGDIELSELHEAIISLLNNEADDIIIKHFAKRLTFDLNASAAREETIMGLEPNLKSGVKLVIINASGKPIAHTVLFPHEPQNQRSQSLRKLTKLCEMYHVKTIAIAKGNAAQETEQLIQELIRENSPIGLLYSRIYDNAAMLIDIDTVLDPSFSVALSVARRLQNPRAELSKANLKYIDYDFAQQEVDQRLLAKAISKTLTSAKDLSNDSASKLITSKLIHSDPNLTELADLTVGQQLQGIISSIRSFGLFVNVGIAQHGLVHISEIKKGYISDPNDVAIVGQRVTVWIKSIDTKNNQFSISCIEPKTKVQKSNKVSSSGKVKPDKKSVQNSAFADAFAKALDNKS